MMATSAQAIINCGCRPARVGRGNSKTLKVILVHPSIATQGWCLVTPRWLFVIAQATPADLVGDPILVDESIAPLNPDIINPGDIVGVTMMTGSCVPGYRVVKQAKLKGATVIVGGIHATLLPDEPLEMGADAVVIGNGDIIWRRVVEDALANRLQEKYAGGRVSGDALLKARWDLLDPSRYLLASLQTAAGCPENCSFCSVWVTDGRRPRLRGAGAIVEEANELHNLGYRCILLADDNFSPATLGRIAREPLPRLRKQLEALREERLAFFDMYDRAVPRNLYAVAQVTAEIASDEEYLSAIYHKMRVRAALVGVESFTEEGLSCTNKQWSPAGRRMVETIKKIQDHGIFVYCSIICGLESDSLHSIRNMRMFVRECGAAVAQFPIFGVYPGTKDFHDVVRDRSHREEIGYVPKRQIALLSDRFWLHPEEPEQLLKHPTMSSAELVREVNLNRRSFYSLGESLRRTRSGALKNVPLPWKCVYVLACLAFRTLYAGHGISFERAVSNGLAVVRRLFMKTIIHFLHQRPSRVGMQRAGAVAVE